MHHFVNTVECIFKVLYVIENISRHVIEMLQRKLATFTLTAHLYNNTHNKHY